MSSLLHLSGVSKRYGRMTVLQGMNLSVAAGERVVVCGPSGSGKSTALMCVNGLVQHDSGTITVDGIVLDHAAGSAVDIRRRVGMVFQQFNLFPHLTVLENCALAPRIVAGHPRAEAEAEAMHWLARVRMAEFAHREPQRLSGGQQQRVAIARALAMRPTLMLFDEPTSALDPELVREVLEVMESLAAEGVTMVVVTHEMGFARAVADRVVFMDAGTVVQDDATEAFFGAPRDACVARFLSELRR